MKIALAQLNATVGDIAGNTAKIAEAVEQAKLAGAQILITPELMLSGYPPEDLLFRDDFNTQVEHALAHLCTLSQGITLVVGHPGRQQNHRYNAASVFRNGELLAMYHKFSLPNHTVFDEVRYFTPGTDACVFEQGGVRFGVNICADVWHEDAPRRAAQAGADVLLVLNASPYHIGKLEERHAEISERIKETGMSVAYCNLVGGQDELLFDGGSFAMNAQGEVTHQFPCFDTGLYFIELEGGIPVKALVSPALSVEMSVYRALVLGLRDYVEKNRFPGVLIGVSGGVDSALTLAIAVDALGADRVHAVMMPSEFTAGMSIDDTREMVATAGVKYSELPIKSLFALFLNELAPLFTDKTPGVTEENVQARVRGTLLMALSNKFGQLVVTTGNKSEMAVGYATLYGDMAGGFALLRDVSKTLVYRLCRYRNIVTPLIPQRVIDRPPSAELRPDQTDQDSLPEYAVLDAIIERYAEWDQSIAAIVAAGYDETEVSRVVRMIDRSEYKRRQAAVGVRITPRGFGKDRRYPITNRFDAGTSY
ncbi:MAG TPA: NAD+ synthase [Burkholderiales bacterium]|nr:NAD+ synthase [Burkholderiales bacterium]